MSNCSLTSTSFVHIDDDDSMYTKAKLHFNYGDIHYNYHETITTATTINNNYKFSSDFLIFIWLVNSLMYCKAKYVCYFFFFTVIIFLVGHGGVCVCVCKNVCVCVLLLVVVVGGGCGGVWCVCVSMTFFLFSSGPIWTHILAREDAISQWRQLMGPTKVLK